MSETLLLIDDNRADTAVNKIVLTGHGYRVLEGSTVTEGRELFRRERPDMVVMESSLPDGSGLDLCREFQQGFYTPIIFVSIRGETKDICAGLGAGATDYLPKPCDMEMLLILIQAHLKLGKKYREETHERMMAYLHRPREYGLFTFYKPPRMTLDGEELPISHLQMNALMLLAEERSYLDFDYLYRRIWDIGPYDPELESYEDYKRSFTERDEAKREMQRLMEAINTIGKGKARIEHDLEKGYMLWQ